MQAPQVTRNKRPSGKGCYQRRSVPPVDNELKMRTGISSFDIQAKKSMPNIPNVHNTQSLRNKWLNPPMNLSLNKIGLLSIPALKHTFRLMTQGFYDHAHTQIELAAAVLMKHSQSRLHKFLTPFNQVTFQTNKASSFVTCEGLSHRTPF